MDVEVPVSAGLPSSDVVEATGATYRQLDYWSRIGLVKASKARGGSGIPRLWPEDEVAILRVMVRLVNAGLEPQAAARVARAGGAAELAPGIVVGVACQH